MKKLKVLHLLASNSFSGAENVACNIIQNTDVDAYYCSPQGKISETLKEKNIKFIPLKKLSINELKKILKDKNIDIIHAHDYKASLLASFFAKNYKIVSHIHCNYRLLKLGSIVSLVYSIIQKKFSKIIVVSDEILQTASFKNKIEEKTVVLNNVIDPKNVIESSKKFKTQNYDLVFVGRLIQLKQPTLFIDIVNKIKKEKPNIKACIIGQGELYDECVNKINEEHLKDNIDILGFKSNPFPYIKNSKVLVIPSTFEGLPMTAVESLILDVPVVNSGVGGFKSMFNKYQHYICNSMDDYIKIITKIINSKNDTYKKECEQIRKKYIDINQYSNTINEIYFNITNGDRK